MDICNLTDLEIARYSKGESEAIPAYVSLGDKSTPVWLQNMWSDGEYSEFIVKNGCGHCCAAMALNLHGVKTDPHGEFALCRKLWGEPKAHQGNYRTVDIDTVAQALYLGAKPRDMTWGEREWNINCAGYVVVG